MVCSPLTKVVHHSHLKGQRQAEERTLRLLNIVYFILGLYNLLMERTMNVSLLSNSPNQTRRVGYWLGRLLRAGDIVLLKGKFGAGKTCLIQGIARGMKIREPVTSPSFVLANEYQPDDRRQGIPLYHIDLYRITDEDEAIGFGLEEYLSGNGVSVVEWANHASDVFPAEALHIELTLVDDHTREINMCAQGQRYIDLLEQLKDTLSKERDHAARH
ncbi:MAG: tRNA (adenosine(37)-N6)-threonylcarbamoyltransferase complex ATPase subunit type 1 TsaE [Chloroflexi bacterium]|nr:tRNA (adenosine(37)-N6)-threonylcarbamoyltransferase complex ATPase subunit type 1 TsaE [Chloroflexota bacterium]MCL5076266.1 tRNA (adenosine(37)-N6)-threonylcarbamoyltransferase complex ATPase subunit type 1 TsaE [Chloroflexota bacterium]